MSKHNYESIAKAIRQARWSGSPEASEAIDSVVDNLCIEFLHDNSRFDADKFRAACAA